MLASSLIFFRLLAKAEILVVAAPETGCTPDKALVMLLILLLTLASMPFIFVKESAIEANCTTKVLLRALMPEIELNIS